jgi:malonyl-CoA O-methyltransferase
MPRWPFLWRTTPELVDPQVAYSLWAPSYPPEPHNRLMEIEQATVMSLLPDVHGRTALDAGCGSGRYLRELRLRGARAVGLDLSDAMLARASAERHPLIRANLCALPIETGSVDVAVCGLALGDVADLALALAELARVLRPDGCLIYSVVHPAGRRAGWSRTFDAGGRVRAIETYWHSVDEHRRACEASGLAVTAWEEPVVEEAPQCPAVLVVRARSGKDQQEIRSSGDQKIGAARGRPAFGRPARGREAATK